MITHAALTPEQQAVSRKYCNIFNLINGLSYVCLGENIIILLAIRMERSNFVISAIGAMLFLGYLLLPLGKFFTARAGAVQCQVVFWIIRNIAILTTALSVPVYLSGYSTAATVMILGGSFVFYGARAAGVAVIQPLYGEITSAHTRSSFIASASAFFYVMSFAGLLLILIVLHVSGSGILPLTGIIVFGGCLGILSTRPLSRMYESGRLCELARRPVMGDLRILLSNSIFIRFLSANFLTNLTVILLNPISLLAAKRGYGISDSQALVFAIVMMGACAFCSFFTAKPMRAFGPRRFCGAVFLLLLATGPLWFFAPAQPSLPFLLSVFALLGGGMVCMTNAMTMYFLQTVNEMQRVVAAILNAVISGAGAGIAGLLVTGSLFRLLTPHFTGNHPPLMLYRMYFICIFLLLLPGIFLIGNMVPLPIEKRRSWKPFTRMIHQ